MRLESWPAAAEIPPDPSLTSWNSAAYIRRLAFKPVDCQRECARPVSAVARDPVDAPSHPSGGCMRRLAKVVSLFAAVLLLIPGSLHAQELASIAGTVRDSSGGVLPGVTVEVTSPALIEKVRSTTSDSNGQFRIAGLPIGRYEVTFSLASFTTVKRQDILLTSGFTAAVDASMGVGNISETI